MQDQENGDKHPVAYASRRLVKHEMNYPAFLLEMQAAVFAMQHFRHLLVGRRFNLYTDHKPLVRLSTVHTKTLNRLQLQMQEMHPDIRHIEGDKNTVADFLSRYQGLGCALVDTGDFRMRHMQHNDELCKLVMAEYRAINPHGPAPAPTKVKSLRFPITLRDGIIKVCNPKRKGTLDPDDERVLIPAALRPELLREAHNSRLGGHGGVFRTTERLRRSFWWPSMDTDIGEHIKKCQACQSTDDVPEPRRKLIHQEPPAGPIKKLHADQFGPLKPSNAGNKYVLVITDAFSHAAHLPPHP